MGRKEGGSRNYNIYFKYQLAYLGKKTSCCEMEKKFTNWIKNAGGVEFWPWRSTKGSELCQAR